MKLESSLARLFILLWRFVSNRWTRWVAAWLVCLGLATHLQHKAIHSFDTRASQPTEQRRRDGNEGHVSIDFGGQWLMGRMLMLGHGRELYDRHRQYEVAQAAYPWSDEAPEQKHHDADDMLGAFVDTYTDAKGVPSTEREGRTRITKQSFAAPLMAGSALEALALTAAAQQRWTPERLEEAASKHVGGPLYPPIQALLFAPLARDNNAQRAYFTIQWIMLGCGFMAGLGLSVLTRGRIWWPVATVLVMTFPGFNGGHELGQNGPLSLAILVWGWVLMARGYQTAGGLVWGLLAFKPVWAAAFLLVPLLTRRWRTCLAMILVGLAMIAATLPFVGVEAWKDWLKVGAIANRTYNVDGNWIPLSRDLLGIPRRLLIDYGDGNPDYWGRDRWYAHVAGWAIWLLVVETTARLSQLYRERMRETTGPAACFLLLGAWMSCFHFMYYDALLAALGFLVLLDYPRQILDPKLIAFPSNDGGPGLDRAALDYFRPRLAQTHPGLTGSGVGRTWVLNSIRLYLLGALLLVQYTLPWLDMGVTVTLDRFGLGPRPVSSAGEPVVKDGKTVTHTPQLRIGTTTHGPPWDTYVLLAVWAGCGVTLMVRGKASDS